MKGQGNLTSSGNNFCDEIDEIMKHENEDVMSLDDSLSATPLDLDLDSISDLLENPRSTSSSFTQPLNIHHHSPTFHHNRSHSNTTTTTTSAYSSLGTSPKFTGSSLNNNQFMQSNHSHPSAYIQRQDNSVFGASHSFDLRSNTNGPSDVKRFRSASMNDGPSLQYQQNKLGIFFRAKIHFFIFGEIPNR
jgi:hypothetical protein